MAERCALFVIICLGEAILVSGRTFAELPFSGPDHRRLRHALSSAPSPCGGSTSASAIGRAAHRIEHDETPGRLGAAGLHLCAYPDSRRHHRPCGRRRVHVLASPRQPAISASLAAVLGGSGLFLIGNLWFKGATERAERRSLHLAGLVLLDPAGLPVAPVHRGLC